MRYKFRAWYLPTKEMVQPEKIESINFEVKTLGVYLPIENKGFNKLRMSDFELMQWTGLHDRNGKEIYEGDIVKYTSKERTGTRVSYKRRGYDTYAINSDIEIIGFIKFDVNDNLMTYIVDTKQVTKYESYFWGEGKRTDRPSITTNSLVKPLSTKREYEVIGNIYENPELMEETK